MYVPENVRMRPVDPHSRLQRESPEPAGGGVPVHACPMNVEQDRSRVTASDCAVDGAADRLWQRDQDHLAALAAHPQHPVAVPFAEVSDIRAGRFERMFLR
jgi:hypothetical protein